MYADPDFELLAEVLAKADEERAQDLLQLQQAGNPDLTPLVEVPDSDYEQRCI